MDCGEATQIQLRIRSVKIQKIDAVFISHLHGDHYFGLVGLLSSMHLLGRKKAIDIYGPALLEKIIRLQIEIDGSRLGYDLNFHHIADDFEGIVFEDKVIEISSFKLKHKVPTHGFVFREKEKERSLLAEKFKESGLSMQHIPSIKQGNDVTDDNGVLHSYRKFTKKPKASSAYAFCSDSAFSENTIKWVKGVDVLYHEATFIKKDKDKAVKTKHSLAEEAALVAREAEVRKLYFGHLSARYNDANQHLVEAREIFPESYEAVEGDVVRL